MQPVFSVIVPCYNEEEVIQETHKRLTRVMKEMGEAYEILYVDDGSRDGTARLLREIASGDENVRVLLFARNAGHQSAVTAGLDYAAGDAIVIIDADLQDPPEIIPLMAEKWRAGAKVVFGQRKKREGETAFKKITASVYYRLLSWLTGGMVPRDTGDFRLVDRQAADVIRSMPEHNRFLRGMFAWAGFQQEAVLYDRDKRFAGKTEYTLKKMLKLAADGIFSFSMKPLQFIAYLGLGFLGVSGLMLLILLLALIFGASGGLWWMAMLLLFCTGCVLTALGIVGEYIARIYDESRGRPLYIMAETLGFGEEQ